MDREAKYKWSDKDGDVREVKTGKQIMSLSAVNCTKKFRNRAGKMMVELLNIEHEMKAELRKAQE